MTSFGDQYALDSVAISQTEKNLDRPILRNLGFQNGEVRETSVFFKLAASFLGNIGHLMKAGDEPFEDPLAYLLRPIRVHPQVLDKRFRFILV